MLQSAHATSGGCMKSVPVQVPGIIALAETGALAVGSRTICALTTTGTKCWGYNDYGQVGDGTQGGGNTSDPNLNKSPSVVAGNHTFVRIAWSSFAVCASEASGATFCWGAYPTNATPSLTPQALVGLPNSYKALTGIVGSSSFCGITTDTSKTYCWGGNPSGELGDGRQVSSTDYIPPQPLPNQN